MRKISEWLDDIYEIMEITIFNRWLWIIIGGMCLAVVMPLVSIMFILMLPTWASATATILIILGWGIAGGYKEYQMHKRKSEEAKAAGKEFYPYTYEEYAESERHRP